MTVASKSSGCPHRYSTIVCSILRCFVNNGAHIHSHSCGNYIDIFCWQQWFTEHAVYADTISRKTCLLCMHTAVWGKAEEGHHAGIQLYCLGCRITTKEWQCIQRLAEFLRTPTNWKDSRNSLIYLSVFYNNFYTTLSYKNCWLALSHKFLHLEPLSS